MTNENNDKPGLQSELDMYEFRFYERLSPDVSTVDISPTLKRWLTKTSKHKDQPYDQFQHDIEQGHKKQLLFALEFCGRAGLIIPQWLHREYASALYSYQHGEVGHLGEAFGLDGFDGKAQQERKKDLGGGKASFFFEKGELDLSLGRGTNIIRAVEKEVELGRALTSDSREGESASQVVGDRFNLSASTITRKFYLRNEVFSEYWLKFDEYYMKRLNK